MAINHAYKVQKEDPSTFVFWVHASSLERFREAYQDIAERLQLPQRNDPTQNVLHLIHRWLIDERNGPWLLIIDNADDKDVLTQEADSSGDSQPLVSYIPRTGRGFILVTSRSERAAEMLVGDDALFPVSEMDESQAKDLLLAKVGSDLYDDDAALELVDALDRMPLAIVQAASFIKRRSRFGETMANYVKKFLSSKQEKKGLLDTNVVDLRRDVSASKTVLAAWQLTFNQMQRERKSAAELLFFMSFFHPQDIPAFMLRAFYDKYECGSLDMDMEILTEYAFISVLDQGRSLEMHALVQFCARTWLSSLDDLEAWRCKFIHIMAAEYPVGQLFNWKICCKLQPHVQRAIEKRPIKKDDCYRWIQLLKAAAVFYHYTRVTSEAETLFRLVVEAETELLGEKDEITLSSKTSLMTVLLAAGKMEEAEAVGRWTLDAMIQTMGEKHPDTLATQSRVVRVLSAQGKMDEAVAMSRTTLEAMRDLGDEELGDDKINIYDLLEMLWLENNPNETEMVTWNLIEAKNGSLAENRCDTLASMHDAESSLRRKEEITAMRKQSFTAKLELLGANHPVTLEMNFIVARYYWDRNRRSEGCLILRECIERRERQPGLRYPNLEKMKSKLKEWELAVEKGSPDTETSSSTLQ